MYEICREKMVFPLDTSLRGTLKHFQYEETNLDEVLKNKSQVWSDTTRDKGKLYFFWNNHIKRLSFG